VQHYIGPGVVQGCRSTTGVKELDSSSVVPDYMGPGVVQGYRCTGAEQGYKDTGEMQCYRVQEYCRDTGV
jgi:hypothetical protein